MTSLTSYALVIAVSVAITAVTIGVTAGFTTNYNQPNDDSNVVGVVNEVLRKVHTIEQEVDNQVDDITDDIRSIRNTVDETRDFATNGFVSFTSQINSIIEFVDSNTNRINALEDRDADSIKADLEAISGIRNPSTVQNVLNEALQTSYASYRESLDVRDDLEDAEDRIQELEEKLEELEAQLNTTQ